jgi:hypothetical protein
VNVIPPVFNCLLCQGASPVLRVCKYHFGRM